MAVRELDAVASRSKEVHVAEQAQRDAILAAFDAGASLRQISKKALLSHEQVRRVVRDHREPADEAFFVTVERHGASPLEVELLVRAASKRAAGERARWIAERKRGGMFEPTRVRLARRHASALSPTDFDDVDC